MQLLRELLSHERAEGAGRGQGFEDLEHRLHALSGVHRKMSREGIEPELRKQGDIQGRQGVVVETGLGEKSIHLGSPLPISQSKCS